MEISGCISSILAQKASQVWSITPETTVFDAIVLMAEKNVGALPVMTGDRVIGVISERDYTRKIILLGRSSKQTAVREIMSQRLLTTTPNETVNECMAIMTANRIRHLPVIEDEKLVGILSIGDLVRWTLSAQAATIEHLERYVTGQYPT